jgi:hypothetical protein
MAEKLMLVCDTCGRPAVETVTFRTSSGNRQRDYCTSHLAELLSGSRLPKRGRKPGSVTKRSGAKKTTRKKPARRTPGRRKSTAKKR